MRNNKVKYPIYLTDTQKKILQVYIEEELKLYNHLNSHLSFQLKTNHMGFLEIAKKLRLFGEAIEHNISIRGVDAEDPPEQLKDIPFDYTFLSNNALNILDGAVVKSMISPRTKRNMGVQMFKYYSSQAKCFNPAGKLIQPLVNLENLELTMKRHIQLHRKAVIVDYDEKQNVTFIKTPYLPKPIPTMGNIKKKRWSILIIHQQPFTGVNASTPWCFDLKETEEDYLLNYIDNPNPFNVSKYVSKDYQRVKF